KKTVVLTVNSTPAMANSRQVVVTCLDSEIELRFRAWIEERRQLVDKATGGKAGYIYVQSTGTNAQNEMMRQFMAQWRKEGLIIDERWNSGGQIPERIGRRRLPVLLPAGRAGAAGRHAHLGRPDRHQRVAGACRRRQRNGADPPHVRPEGRVVRGRARGRAG